MTRYYTLPRHRYFSPHKAPQSLHLHISFMADRDPRKHKLGESRASSSVEHQALSFVSLFLCNFLQSRNINFRTPISKPDCRCVCRTPASISSRVLRVLSQEVGGCGSSAPGLLGADAIPGMLMPVAIRGRNLKTWVRGYSGLGTMLTSCPGVKISNSGLRSLSGF